ncbi:mitochondrial carrier domain-containing protein [Zychaea mexicana]|uniref:mitochondrial carrier domain-containing protein n=1 Tax=Zychaea mexicana TaxID=64656 RepID=UPI0022FE9F71|nr:mitochondrial carrier domain-containing protein [Zychaea mexicana]KAI9491065.1 mitochondrial carrier domain-containing protein [Zychaea mexicana]
MAESVNDFIAGWISGAAGIIVGSPLDVLKARLQAPKPAAGMTTEPLPTAWQTLTRMVKYEGASSMFKGVLAPVLGLAGLNAVLFFSYGSIIRAFERQFGEAKALGLLKEQQDAFMPSLGQVYIAGCGAGIASFLFSAPTELVKIKAQVSHVPKSSLQVVRETLARDGLRGLYQGGWITIIRDAPSYGIYFWVYEGMKRLWETDASKSNAWQLLLAGGTAGVVSWSSIYPIDVVKSRLQMQVVPPARVLSSTAMAVHAQQQQQQHSGFAVPSRLANPGERQRYGTLSAPSAASTMRPYTSIKDCVVRSYQTEGISVFFRGLGPTVLRAFPVNAVTFFVYEMTIDFLGG